VQSYIDALITFPAGMRSAAGTASPLRAGLYHSQASARETHFHNPNIFNINPIAAAQQINGAKSSIFRNKISE
jgi:hypothetical protein